MKRFTFLAISVFCLALSVFAQNRTTTVNNTITINGNVYYFKPSTTPSSPQPKVGSSNFIGYGRWYGADAAKAWASIADWAIEHCEYAEPPIKGHNGERVYISSVEAGENRKYYGYNHAITIYYWIVAANAQMEDGRRETRTFCFN